MEGFGMPKETPYAYEVERSVIGACMMDNGQFHHIKDILNPDCFYNAEAKRIFEAMVDLDDSDTVSLSGKYNFDISMLANYLSDGHPNYEYHCQILIEKKIQRDLIRESQQLLNESWENNDVYEVLDKLSELSERIGVQSGIKKTFTVPEIVKRDAEKPKAEKLFLGYSDLDNGIYADSMKRGQVELTIADSGHGKTQYALFKAECLLRGGYKVGWFQLEGYDSETAQYMIDGDVPYKENIFISDSLYDIEDIKRESRKLNREHGLDYIIFDYVQNIECSKNLSRTEKVEYISRQITRLAKELNVVCNPLSQITISYSTRDGWKQEPSYGDVRWSQQLKQDASIITSVFRPSRIESLALSRENVKDWKDRQVPYNSVFIKQAKVRHGVQEWKRFHMIHTDKGLKPYQTNTYNY